MSVSQPLNAQETTPEPLPPTELPTNTPFPTATATFTETPTLTPTAMLTETATPTTLPTNTETPTVTPLVVEATGEAIAEPLLATVMPTEGPPPPAVERSSFQLLSGCGSEDFTIITRTGTDGGDDLEAAVNCANSGQVPLPYRIFIADTITAGNPIAIDVKLNITSSIKIYGRGAAASVLQSTGVVLFEIQNGGSLELHHVTVRGGRQGIPYGASAYGGGIYNRSILFLADSIVTDNNTLSGGGGIMNDANATLIITRSELTQNHANGGGAIQNNGNMTVTCSRVENNTAIFGAGFFLAGGSASIENNKLEANTAAGPYAADVYSLYSVTVHNNYWGTNGPNVAPSDEPVDASSPLTSDPTLDTTLCPQTQPEPIPSGETPTQQIINELATYGLVLFPEGIPNDWPTRSPGSGTDYNGDSVIDSIHFFSNHDPLNQVNAETINPNATGSYPQAWTLTELQEIQEGVQQTARALYLLSTGIDDGSGTTQPAKDLFTQIMLIPEQNLLYILRVQNGFSFDVRAGQDGCFGTNNSACTNNPYVSIAFYGSVNVTRYTLVHELGHRFNFRTGGALNSAVDQTRQNCVNPSTLQPTGNCIIDTAGDLVMGTFDNGWRQGVRGWGSVPNSSITDFHQHPTGVGSAFPNDDDLTQTDETSADMFLNWVYRKLSDNPPTLYSQAPGNWEGFLNIDAAGNPDASYPGDERFIWMNGKMDQIFTQNGW